MFTNRITGHLAGSMTQAHTRPEESRSDSRAKRKSTNVPAGFALLPYQFQAPQQFDLYRSAFEAAHAAARQKLLDLLRARAGWN